MECAQPSVKAAALTIVMGEAEMQVDNWTTEGGGVLRRRTTSHGDGEG